MENLARVNDNNFDRLQARRGLTVKNNSQMSKVSEHGLGIEAAERQDAAVRAKLEARVQGLNQLLAELNSLQFQLASFGLHTKEKQKTLLTAALGHVDLIRNREDLPIGASKPLRVVRNAMVSIREGLMTGSYSKQERQNLSIHEVETARTAVQALLDKSVARLEQVGHEPVEAGMEEVDAQTAAVIARVQDMKTALLAIKTKPLVLSRAPIVPVTTTNLRLDKLTAMGVKAESMGGYPVLHDQRIIGINRDALQADARGKPERAIEAATRFMASLRETVAPLTMVCSRATPHSGGSWYWVADRATLKALRDAAGGTINVADWGFGFGD